MPEVEVPFTDKKVDSSDPSGSLMTVLSLVLGSALLIMVFNYGQDLGDWMTRQTDSVLGTNASEQNNERLGSID